MASSQRKQHSGHRSEPVYNVTGADTSLTEDQSHRVKVYTIQMVIRTLCFVGAFIASGWLRWALVLGAVILPYTAVLFANNTRVVSTTYLDPVQQQSPQLETTTVESPGDYQGTIIQGELVSDSDPTSEQGDGEKEADPTSKMSGGNRDDESR